MALQHVKPAQVVKLSSSNCERSTALVKTEDFETIRLVVASGAKIPSHQVPGKMTLHCLDGHVEIGLVGQPVVMKTNDWLYLEGGAIHSVKGLADSTLLLTILLRPDDASQGAKSTYEREVRGKPFHDYTECGCVERWEAEGGKTLSAE